MKQLKRLSLSGLANVSTVLSVREQMNIYAGYGGIDGVCYFEALEILSTQFGCNKSLNDYMNDFGHKYGYQSIMSVDNRKPNFTGVEPSLAAEYLYSQFEAVSVSEMGYDSVLGKGQVIMTDMNVGNGVTHAIVIVGMEGGQYLCRDARNDKPDDKPFRVSPGQLASSFGMAVSGCKR